ncbi:MAG TPA: HEAT repeat domain-containing protein [Thermoanaerobaculia bacterium]
MVIDPIVPVLAIGGVLMAGYTYVQKRLVYWQGIEHIAHRYLDEVRVSGWPWSLMLHGRAGPLRVLMADIQHQKSIQVVVEILGPPGFSELSIRRECHVPWKTREIEVGSEPFDHTFFVAGPIQLVLSLLDAEARDLLLRVNAHTSAGNRLEIVSGRLQVETADSQLSLVLPLLLALGKRFDRPLGVERRLAQNATQDPEAGVRLQNLLLLIREFPEREKTLEALRAACSDPSPEFRLRVGKGLGAGGRGVLMELAENLENDAVSADAVSFLGRELSPETAQAILRRTLRKRYRQTARACLEVLGHHGDASAAGLLVEVMKREKGELAVFAAQALERAGSPEAEGPLIQALRRDEPALQVAAAKALGRFGSSSAVLPLKEVAERFSGHLALSQAARQAVAEIQYRLPGASPGQLSLAGAEVGQLSLAQAEAGQLSLASDPAGKLSLSGPAEESRRAEEGEEN